MHFSWVAEHSMSNILSCLDRSPDFDVINLNIDKSG